MPRRPLDMPTLPRWLSWLAWGSVGLAVVVLFGVCPLNGGDFWMHLFMGKYTWQHGGPPLVDEFSYMSAGREFIAHCWLAGLMFYLIEESTGLLGLMLLRFALIAVAVACAVRTARLLKTPWPVLMLLTPLALAVLWGRLEFRPYLFTTAFLSIELSLLMSVHVGRRSWRWL
jgi:hypothetical protein